METILRKTPKTRSKLTRERLSTAAHLMKNLANVTRLTIAYALIEGERSVGDLERSLGLPQPHLSQHLAQLRDSGMVIGRREAKQVFYRISDQRAFALLAVLPDILVSKMPSMASAAAALGPKPQSIQAAMFARVELG